MQDWQSVRHVTTRFMPSKDVLRKEAFLGALLYNIYVPDLAKIAHYYSSEIHAFFCRWQYEKLTAPVNPARSLLNSVQLPWKPCMLPWLTQISSSTMKRLSQ